LRDKEDEIKKLREVIGSVQNKARNQEDERVIKKQEEEIFILRKENRKLKDENVRLINRVKALEDVEERSTIFFIT
jgi:hypothetical protein